MRDQLEQKLARFEELERMLLDPEVQTSSARISAVAREHGSLAKMATKYRRFKGLNAQIAEANEMPARRRHGTPRSLPRPNCPN